MNRLLSTALAFAICIHPAVQSTHAQDGVATFRSNSDVVVLHLAVRDRRGAYVGGLGRESFRVLEDGQPQTISFFDSQDAPVTVGLLMDGSGSMAPHRDLIVTASLAFSKAMNPSDEFFVLGFNERVRAPLPPDAPFTQHEPTLRVALVQAISARGQTAIYDAIDSGLSYVKKGSYERQVLIVLSDGGDNASTKTTRSRVLQDAQASNAVVYTVALVDPLESEADPGFLAELAQVTGGISFRPQRAEEISEALQRIARDIRSMYTIGYVPKEVGGKGDRRLRRIEVEVRTPEGRKLQVRTRRAYLAAPAEEIRSDAR